MTCNQLRRCVNAVVGTTADGNAVAPNEGNTSVATATRGFEVCYGSTSQSITLQITNLDYTMEEASLRNFIMGQLKPITPVLSLVFEGNTYAKVTVPDMFVSNLSYKSGYWFTFLYLQFAKQVVSNLHRKKIGHKRMLVSYTRDSSQTEINTLRCQVAGLLKVSYVHKRKDVRLLFDFLSKKIVSKTKRSIVNIESLFYSSRLAPKPLERYGLSL